MQLTNGCICCTLREDLLQEVARLAREGRFDYLLIEATGIAEPMPIAATFTFTDEDGVGLSDVSRLDTMVTVIDAARLLDDLDSLDDLKDRVQQMTEDDERTVATLLVDQLEFADVLIVNKVDLVTEEQIARVEALVRGLNRGARIVRATHGRVPLEAVLDTGRFDFDRAAEAPGWVRELQRGDASTHTPETEEYGFQSFVYRARTPFHPERLWSFIHTVYSGVVRSKGHFWVATRPDDAHTWSQAGNQFQIGYAGEWWAATPASEWPDEPETTAEILRGWEEPFGDRQNELVFIGVGIDEKHVRTGLDACLLTPEEVAAGPGTWARLPDPLPAFGEGSA